jgi:hypothetical protein
VGNSALTHLKVAIARPRSSLDDESPWFRNALGTLARRPVYPLDAFPPFPRSQPCRTRRRVAGNEPRPAPFDEPRLPVLIRRISCSFSFSDEMLFSFPLRYLFAIGYSLSYLALDGQHHPYSASTFKLTYSRARPLLAPPTRSHVTLCVPGSQPGTVGFAIARLTLRLQVPKPQGAEGFGLGLIPVRSQLLGESLLISFPPLTYMLKFSG